MKKIINNFDKDFKIYEGEEKSTEVKHLMNCVKN